MANVAEEDQVSIACSLDLVVAAILAASAMLTKVKKKDNMRLG